MSRKSWKKRWKKNKYGYDYYDYDYGESDSLALKYDYDFHKPLYQKDHKKRWEKEWDAYKTTGYWRGYSYYQPQLLDYRYIEQMANAFANRYKVNVRIGQNWQINLETKTLEYNPSTLLTFTKAQLIATILHEIGHLRYTTPAKLLNSVWLKKYPKSAFFVLNLFEDFRIDNLVLGAYAGAEDVFEGQKDQVKQIAKRYEDANSNLIDVLKQLKISLEQKTMNKKQDYPPYIIKIIKEHDFFTKSSTTFPTELINSIPQENVNAPNLKPLIDLLDNMTKEILLFDYCGYILLTGYKEKVVPKKEIENYARKTEHAIPLTIQAGSTQEVVDILGREVYPVIEPILDILETSPLKAQQMGFGLDAQFIKQQIEKAFFEANNLKNNQNNNYNNPFDFGVRSSGEGEVLPLEWSSGDYNPLLNSVRQPITTLYKKLMFLRRSAETPLWEAKKTRGKLHTKTLFQHKLGSIRLFKKKLPKKDKTRQFAVSLIVDTSGSMNGSPIIHTLRGVVMLNEVFEKLGVPFEVIRFDVNAKHIKTFEEVKTTKDAKSKLAGCVNNLGGSTNLFTALKITKIANRHEKNRLLVVLSDGGVHGSYADDIKKIKKKGVKVFGLGLNCGSEITRICGEGEAIDDAIFLPDVFTKLVKKVLN